MGELRMGGLGEVEWRRERVKGWGNPRGLSGGLE